MAQPFLPSCHRGVRNAEGLFDPVAELAGDPGGPAGRGTSPGTPPGAPCAAAGTTSGGNPQGGNAVKGRTGVVTGRPGRPAARPGFEGGPAPGLVAVVGEEGRPHPDPLGRFQADRSPRPAG